MRSVWAEQVKTTPVDELVAHIEPGEPVYVTLDIDVLDPAIAPGTGTPEPGGFTYYEAKALLRAVARRGTLVGMDLVEVDPLYDPAQLTALHGVRLALDTVGAAFAPRPDRLATPGSRRAPRCRSRGAAAAADQVGALATISTAPSSELLRRLVVDRVPVLQARLSGVGLGDQRRVRRRAQSPTSSTISSAVILQLPPTTSAPSASSASTACAGVTPIIVR